MKSIDDMTRNELIAHAADALNSLDENGAIAAILKGCDPVCLEELRGRLDEWEDEPGRRQDILEILLAE